jgi:hypothetical protein
MQVHCAMLANASATTGGAGGGADAFGYPYACGLINVVHMLLDITRLLPVAAGPANAQVLARAAPKPASGRAHDRRRARGQGDGGAGARFPNKRAAACRRALGGLLLSDKVLFHAFCFPFAGGGIRSERSAVAHAISIWQLYV